MIFAQAVDQSGSKASGAKASLHTSVYRRCIELDRVAIAEQSPWPATSRLLRIGCRRRAGGGKTRTYWVTASAGMTMSELTRSTPTAFHNKVWGRRDQGAPEREQGNELPKFVGHHMPLASSFHTAKDSVPPLL